MATHISVLKELPEKAYRKIWEVLAIADTSKSILPTKEQIGQRAYEIYLARGCEDGYDLSDWLEAEIQLSKSTEQQAKKTRAATASL